MLISDILRLNASKTPEQPAITYDGQTRTYAELRDEAWRLANALRTVAKPGDRVGMLAENIPEYIAAYYGVPAAGMALTFLNYRLHPREWMWILNNAEATVLIIQGKFVTQVADLLAEHAPSIRHVIVIDDGTPVEGSYVGYAELVGGASADEPPRDVDDDSTAWLLYTSGTTGFPKGAMLTHRNLVTAVVESVIEYAPERDEVYLVAFPLCHVSGYLVPVNQFRGGSVVVTNQFEPEQWMRLVEDHRVTSTAMAPTMLNMVLQHPAVDEHDLSSLRGIGYGAAAMPVEILRAALKRFGPIVFSGFGMTELGGNVLTFPKADHARAASGDEHLLASCGRVMCMADVKVVDEHMVECPPGVVGEIVIRGDQVFSGYFRNEGGTDAAFADGWFKTGDLAKRDEEGFFYIVDRSKDMIITGGENVYSREVEEALYEHPAVSEAAVIGVPDPQWGENVTAVVVLRPGATATEDEIIDSARRRLAGFKKPKRVHFVDEMPKTVTGKILKRELRDKFSSDAT